MNLRDPAYVDRQLRPRWPVFEAYWRLAAERQRIFYVKLNGAPPPWTADVILRRWKFTNAFRASDRTSQFLIQRVIYNPALSTAPEDVVTRILLFKFFNKIETWAYHFVLFGEPRAATFATRLPALWQALEQHRCAPGRDNGDTLFGHAYMIPPISQFNTEKPHASNVPGGVSKSFQWLRLIEFMLNDGFVSKLLACATFEAVYDLLRTYPGFGAFLAYQIATDLNYSTVINFDENDFTKPGPGADRGIVKVFESTGDATPEEAIFFMVRHQDDALRACGIDPAAARLFGKRPLHAIDCQNLFCETDKYSRKAFPELESNRTEIKTKYVGNRPRPLADVKTLFYPPKWDVNRFIPDAWRTIGLNET